MCESVPSTTVWGTTRITSTITSSTVSTAQVAQSTKLVTSQITTHYIITTSIPQKTLYYPCSASATQTVKKDIRATSTLDDGVTVDPKATGQFTGSLPSQAKSTMKPDSTTTSSVPTQHSSLAATISSISKPSVTSKESKVNENHEGSTKKPTNTGKIAGGVVGGITILVLLCNFGIWFYRRRQRIKSRRRTSNESFTNDVNHVNKYNNKGKGNTDKNGNDFWERRFREIESTTYRSNSMKSNHSQKNGEKVSDNEKGHQEEWDNQTSRKLHLTLDLGSKNLNSRPPSRLSMISSFFGGGKSTPTANVISSSSKKQIHDRTASTSSILQSLGGNRSQRPSVVKGASVRFSLNPFSRKPNYHDGSGNKVIPSKSNFHNRSISSPAPLQLNRDSSSTVSSFIMSSAGYSNSFKSPGPPSTLTPGLEQGFHNISIHRTASNDGTPPEARNTFGNKLSSFDQYDRSIDVKNVHDNINNWNNQTISYPAQAHASQGPDIVPHHIITNTSPAIREGNKVRSPTYEQVEERRNMEWIRRSTMVSIIDEGEETLDTTDEDKMNQLKSQLGINTSDEFLRRNNFRDSISGDNGNDSTQLSVPPKSHLRPKPEQPFHPSIGDTPPQLGILGDYLQTASSIRSHLSGISSITSLPSALPKNSDASNRFSIVGSGSNGGSTTSLVALIPPPRGASSTVNLNRHKARSDINISNEKRASLTPSVDSISVTTFNEQVNRNQPSQLYRQIQKLPFLPLLRGGHGSVSGYASFNIPSAILPRGYLSGLSSQHSVTTNTRQTYNMPKSPDSTLFPSSPQNETNNTTTTEINRYSNMKHNNLRDSNSLQRERQRGYSQYTVSESNYSVQMGRPLERPDTTYSTQPSFGYSRPSSQFLEWETDKQNTNINRNTRTLSVYKSERGSVKLSNYPKPPLPPPVPPLPSATSNRLSGTSIKSRRRSIKSSRFSASGPVPPLPKAYKGSTDNDSRKSAFIDAEEDEITRLKADEIENQFKSSRSTAILPRVLSSYFLDSENDNIDRRSLKNKRKSKGLVVPKDIKLNQRALTPSLWLDEEVLARFADAESIKSESRKSECSPDSPVPPEKLVPETEDLSDPEELDQQIHLQRCEIDGLGDPHNEIHNPFNPEDEVEIEKVNDAVDLQNEHDSISKDENLLVSRFPTTTFQSATRPNSIATTIFPDIDTGKESDNYEEDLFQSRKHRISSVSRKSSYKKPNINMFSESDFSLERNPDDRKKYKNKNIMQNEVQAIRRKLPLTVKRYNSTKGKYPSKITQKQDSDVSYTSKPSSSTCVELMDNASMIPSSRQRPSSQGFTMYRPKNGTSFTKEEKGKFRAKRESSISDSKSTINPPETSITQSLPLLMSPLFPKPPSPIDSDTPSPSPSPSPRTLNFTRISKLLPLPESPVSPTLPLPPTSSWSTHLNRNNTNITSNFRFSVKSTRKSGRYSQRGQNDQVESQGTALTVTANSKNLETRSPSRQSKSRSLLSVDTKVQLESGLHSETTGSEEEDDVNEEIYSRSTVTPQLPFLYLCNSSSSPINDFMFDDQS